MSETGLVQILEGALMAAGEPLSVKRLVQLFDELERPTDADIKTALHEVAERCEGRGYELVEVASGWRFQVRQHLSTWVGRLWQERPQRYSRALLETLSLIAYRQPITRGEIEEIRGVAVSSNIIKTLQERDWVRIVGHRDVPGRPAMYATTRQFLDYFNLKSLEDLPPLAEIKELDNLSGNLPLDIDDTPEGAAAETDGVGSVDTESPEDVATEDASENADAPLSESDDGDFDDAIAALRAQQAEAAAAEHAEESTAEAPVPEPIPTHEHADEASPEDPPSERLEDQENIRPE